LKILFVMGWLSIEDEGMWQIWFLIAGYGHVWLMDSGMLGVGCLGLEVMDQDSFDRGIGSCGFGACMD
jgi:hypothetical protein